MPVTISATRVVVPTIAGDGDVDPPPAAVAAAGVAPTVAAVRNPTTVSPAAAAAAAAPAPAVSGGASGSITHGDQLTVSDVGPWSLQGVAKGSESLDTVSVPARGYFRADTPYEFVPNQTFVNNTTASNKGGVVPAGGMTIDGYTVPAGTYVCQFRNMSGSDTNFQGDAGGTFLFRGCRFRNSWTAPGCMNNSGTSTSTIYVGYSDMGGTNATTGVAESVLEFQAAAGARAYRNYLTWWGTGIFLNVSGSEIIENYVTEVVLGEAGWHLNGMSCSGSITHCRVERNHVTLPTPDDAGNTISQTDCISFFQETYSGPYMATGTNSDGTTGYRIINNYVGGNLSGIFYGGEPADGPVNGMQFIGNKVTTQWGINNVMTNGPTWGTNGNVWSGNTWADGANAGETIVL